MPCSSCRLYLYELAVTRASPVICRQRNAFDFADAVYDLKLLPCTKPRGTSIAYLIAHKWQKARSRSNLTSKTSPRDYAKARSARKSALIAPFWMPQNDAF